MLIKMSLPKESDPQSLVETQDPKEPLGKKKQSQTKPLLNWKVFWWFLRGILEKKQGCLINNLLNLAAYFQNQHLKPKNLTRRVATLKAKWILVPWIGGLFLLDVCFNPTGGALGLKTWAPNWAWESKLGKCRLLEICEDLLGGTRKNTRPNHRQTQGASQSVNTFTVGTISVEIGKGCARRISISPFWLSPVWIHGNSQQRGTTATQKVQWLPWRTSHLVRPRPAELRFFCHESIALPRSLSDFQPRLSPTACTITWHACNKWRVNEPLLKCRGV